MNSIDVVISGIGGRFPKSRNIKEFSDNLLSGENLLRPIDRWPAGLLNTPKFAGLTDDVDRFDYTFFGMHFDLCKRSDAQTRLAIETAFEALIDAGVNPTTIRGSNAHVYSATLISDFIMDEKLPSGKRSGYIILGKTRSMSANRISYCLNLSGHSCAYDASSGWLGTGLALARKAIQSGECDTAFVNASSVMIMLEIMKQKQNLGLLSPDGTCRPFAVDANGVAQGEAQVTFLVQRADIAKRSYGSIVLAGAESRLSLPNWFLSLDQDHFQNYISSLYQKNGINPNKVKLLEADGLAIKDMVEAELNALDIVLNEKRPENSPLYVGTVKTITGDTEGAAGHTALTKLILAMETGVISPTLDYGNLNPNLRGLVEGRLKVVTEPTQWDVTPDTHVAVSSLTTTGLVSHVVLKANGKTKRKHEKTDGTHPYLVVISGRTESSVRDSLNTVVTSTFDPEYLRLTQEVFAPTIDKFDWKGYGFHDEPEKLVVQRENRRPVWFVYSGMGSQWATMGRELMGIPLINDTFKRLHKVLEPKGLDLIHILTAPNPEIFECILHSFVGIAAVQIALTNLLRQLGVVPDGMIGHSVGELGCSYADDCLTEEQTILASYQRGMASLEAKLIVGLMASVGLGHEKTKELLPPDVYVACHNAKDNCTISGPTESVKKVIADFEEKGLFVRGVNVSNIAYHSPYIKPAAPLLYESLIRVIPSPKLRSSKWVCTSAPKEKWDTDAVRYCSADYHTNNLLGEVLFEEGLAYVPKNALLIEIAPHGLLQPILKRWFGTDAAFVPLTRRESENPIKFLFEAFGKLFLEGQSPKIWHLYPNVEMPVSRSTPSLAPLVKWEHSENFPLVDVPRTVPGRFFRCLLNNSLPNIEIGGSKCYPAAFALVQTYNSFAEIMFAETNTLQVVFENVRFYDTIKFDEKETVEVVVTISPTTGAFSVTRNDVQVVSGKIRALNKQDCESKKLPNVEGNVELTLSSDDIYSELRSRGVIVPKKLRNIEEVNIRHHDSIAKISNNGDYGSLVNSFLFLFQLGNESVDRKSASVSHINQLIIDPASNDIGDNEARLHLPTGTLLYPGFSMSGVEFRSVDTAVGVQPLALRFVPFGQSGIENETHFLSNVLQLNSERRWQKSSIVKICDIDGELTSVTHKLHDLLKSDFVMTATPEKADLIVCGPSAFNSVASNLAKSDKFLLTRCSGKDLSTFKKTLTKLGLVVIAESDAKGSNDFLIAISCLLPPLEPSAWQIIKMKPHDALPASLESPNNRLSIFVWENDISLPVEKLLSDAMSAGYAEKIRIIVVMTKNAPAFSLNLPLYAEQLRLNVPLNVYLDGKWGNYRLLPITESLKTLENGHGDFGHQADIVFNDMNGNVAKLDPSSFQIHDIFDHKSRPLSSKKVIAYNTKHSAPGNIMGLATLEDESNYVDSDPVLFWNAPEESSCVNVAPELFSYAMAYYIVFDIAQSPRGKRMLVTCPLTHLGQAVIRVANSINCEIVLLVSSDEEKKQVRNIFPKANAIVSSSDSFSCMLKKLFPEGVHIIVSDLSGARLRAGTECLHDFGTFVQVDEEAMLTAENIGMNFFVKNAVVYGVPPEALLNATLEVKRQVHQWVEEGLRSGLVVPGSVAKVNGSVSNGAREPIGNRIYNTNKSYNGKENDTSSMLFKTSAKRRNGALIIGGSKAQWIGLSYSLALKGCKLIALKEASTSASLISRHSKIIRREFDVELRDVTNVHSGADLVDSDVGNLSHIVVFGYHSFAEEVLRELDARGINDVSILFFGKNSDHFVRMCERRTQKGLKFRAALGTEDEPISRATLDWLLSPLATTVTVLNQRAFVSHNHTWLTDSGLLPTSGSELRTLGAAVSKYNAPNFQEFATSGMKLPHVGEVKPVFFIKGLHETADRELEILASGLLAPLVGVTLHAFCGTLEATAAAVVRGILRMQKRGPFNLAGDIVRSDVVIKVARMLEEKGHASVVFLMSGHIANIRQSLKNLQKVGNLGEIVLKTLLSDSINAQSWNSLSIGNMEWREQVQTTLNLIPSQSEKHRKYVGAALQHIYTSMQHILEAEDETKLKHGILRFLREGYEYREFELTDRCFEYTIPATKLKRKEIGDIFSANLATPVLQLRFDREKEKQVVSLSLLQQ